MTPPRPEEAVDRNGSGGIALTALPYGALTTSIINLPNVFDKVLTEEKISSGPGGSGAATQDSDTTPSPRMLNKVFERALREGVSLETKWRD